VRRTLIIVAALVVALVVIRIVAKVIFYGAMAVGIGIVGLVGWRLLFGSSNKDH
jgi:hypothetical protein